MQDASNIIALKDTGFPLTKRDKPMCRCSVVGKSYPYGPAPGVWVDEQTRKLECKHCGATIDLFDYVWVLAVEGESICRRIGNIREEKTALEAQLKMLNEQIRDARTEVKKCARKSEATAAKL